MRRLMNTARCLFEDTDARADEAFNAPFQLLLKSFTPADPKWSEAVRSQVNLPDGSSLLIQAAKRVVVRRRKPGEVIRPRSFWEVGFGRSRSKPQTPLGDLEDDDWSDAATGQGIQQRIFATVLHFIQQLVKEYKPEEIRFGVETASGRGDRRASLYHRMAQRFAGPMGYEVVTEPDPNDAQATRFRILRNS